MNLLQRLRLLPAQERRFGFWRTVIVCLATGGVLGTTTMVARDPGSVPDLQRVGIPLAFTLAGLPIPWLWNRRAVALGAPGFWAA